MAKLPTMNMCSILTDIIFSKLEKKKPFLKIQIKHLKKWLSTVLKAADLLIGDTYGFIIHFIVDTFISLSFSYILTGWRRPMGDSPQQLMSGSTSS